MISKFLPGCLTQPDTSLSPLLGPALGFKPQGCGPRFSNSWPLWVSPGRCEGNLPAWPSYEFPRKSGPCCGKCAVWAHAAFNDTGGLSSSSGTNANWTAVMEEGPGKVGVFILTSSCFSPQRHALLVLASKAQRKALKASLVFVNVFFPPKVSITLFKVGVSTCGNFPSCFHVMPSWVFFPPSSCCLFLSGEWCVCMRARARAHTHVLAHTHILICSLVCLSWFPTELLAEYLLNTYCMLGTGYTKMNESTTIPIF